ncbi:hypothetical protein SAMD00079811_54160 [Scytonema sp. HK-05]|nr:hypothetical protein SAMD00079811_54160 [Scytonema sp. HK-05]
MARTARQGAIALIIERFPGALAIRMLALGSIILALRAMASYSNGWEKHPIAVA